MPVDISLVALWRVVEGSVVLHILVDVQARLSASHHQLVLWRPSTGHEAHEVITFPGLPASF